MMTFMEIGKVVAIALRLGVKAPMMEVQEATAVAEGGLAGDVRAAPDRGMTLISAPQWNQVCKELGVGLPWHTRRANVLIDVASLSELAGRTLQVGSVEVGITGETRPCGLMDELHPGLRAALAPGWRGGVTCRIIRGGTIRVGDAVRVGNDANVR